MIRNNPLPGTHSPQHKATVVVDLPGYDTRDYPAHVCPGQHCLGRAQGMTGHRHTEWPVHTLTPEQAARADKAMAFQNLRGY